MRDKASKVKHIKAHPTRIVLCPVYLTPISLLVLKIWGPSFSFCCLVLSFSPFTSEPRNPGVPRSLSFFFFFVHPETLESRGWCFLLVSAPTLEPLNPKVVPCLVCFLLSTSEPWSPRVPESQGGVLSCLPWNPRVLRCVLFVYLRIPESRGRIC